MAPVYNRLLVLTLGGTDVSTEVTTYKVRAAKPDNGTITLAEGRAGAKKDYFLDLGFLQDLSTASIWSRIWDHSGDTVAFRCGQADASGALDTTAPYISGNAVISAGDGDWDVYGGDASDDPGARAETSVSWKCTAKPTVTRPA